MKTLALPLVLLPSLAACSSVEEPADDPIVVIGKSMTVLDDCTLESVPFSVAFDHDDPIHYFEAPSGSLPKPHELGDEVVGYGGLTTGQAHLCPTPPTVPGEGSPCRGIDAFSWGLDWIPAVEEEDAWRLDDLSSSAVGWGILFFERDDELYAYGWGPLLGKTWPLLGLTGLPINEDLIRSDAIAPADQTPLYTAAELGAPGGAGVYGVDFNGWFPHVGPGWGASCFLPPTSEDAVAPRLYYSVPKPESGGGDASMGQVIYWIEPKQVSDEVWVWTRPQRLSERLIPGLPEDADIDALSFQRYDLDQEESAEQPAGEATTEDLGLMLISLIPAPLVDPHVIGGDPVPPPDEVMYYGVSVHQNAEGQVWYGEAKPLLTHTGRPIRDVVGPRSRGACTVDPRLFMERQ